jgi:Fur family transcriptional regulator, ferric uptake regulator
MDGRDRLQPPPPAEIVEEWRLGVERALSREGYRFTAPRRAILDWIAACGNAFTPETLSEALEARCEPSSRATVYRLINWLHAAGWLTRVHTPGPGSPGEPGTGLQHAYGRALPGHYSAVCWGCSTVLIVRAGDLAAQIAPALAASGFAVRGHHLELYGLCDGCVAHEGTRAAGGLR